MEHINTDYEFLLKPREFTFTQYMIIESKIWYRKNIIGFNFTEKELNIAQKRVDGFIGIKNNCRCYIKKLM